MFLDYAHVAEQAGQPVNKLKYFFCENIVNQQTSFAVYHALDEELTEENCAEYVERLVECEYLTLHFEFLLARRKREIVF